MSLKHVKFYTRRIRLKYLHVNNADSMFGMYRRTDANTAINKATDKNGSSDSLNTDSAAILLEYDNTK